MEWRYRVIKLQGQGAFGDVYQAQDLVMQRVVAKKVLRVRNEENLKRFKRDDSMLRKYEGSPYFVDLYDSDVIGARPYLILEYSSLGSLQGYIGKSIDWQRGARWLCDIARGLEVMHANGDMHRDIKPGNLLLFQYKQEVVKFTEFGYGIKADTSGPLTNSVFGTIGYADPVAIRTGVYFPQADVYATARTMTAIFTGNPQPTIFRMLPGPVEFRNLIDSMMSPNIHQRPTPRQIYQTVESLLSASQASANAVPNINWGTVAKFGIGALAVLALCKSNTWDEDVQRYRNSKGHFASN